MQRCQIEGVFRSLTTTLFYAVKMYIFLRINKIPLLVDAFRLESFSGSGLNDDL